MLDNGGLAGAIAGVIDRPRLNRILDASLVRVCVVEGPSGCGKTTLVRSWARQHPVPSVWVSLNGGITSRKAFWIQVAMSASRLGELSEEGMAEIERQLSYDSDPVRIACELLANAGPFVIVLDAFEHLGDTLGDIEDDLALLVREAPELRLVITTRRATRLAELVPDDGSIVRVISLWELALTVDEVRELLRVQTGVGDPALAASVVSATRGFALAVRAVALTLSQIGRVPHADSKEWNEIVAARLESLLPDPETVQFVTDTSVPPYVDLELGRVLSGNPHAERLFAMLERNGFGRWIPYALGRQVFQYVETIRDTFRTRATRDATRFKRSCVATAAWLLENEEVVEQALQFAIDGEDYALADRVFVEVVIGNPDSYITDRFLRTLQKVPEAVLDDYPMLAFGLSLALGANTILRGESASIAEIAVRAKPAHGYVEPAFDAFALAAMQAIARRLALRFGESSEASLEVVRAAEAFLPALPPELRGHVGTILRQLSYSLFQGDRFDEAMAVINRSVSLCQNQVTRDYSMVYVACYSAFTGDIERSKALAASIDTAAWPAEFRQSYMNAPGLVAEAFQRLDALDFDGAVVLLRGTRSYVHTAEFWPFIMCVSVAARHGLGQGLAEARRVARELANRVPPPGTGDNAATERLRASAALALLSGGDPRAAEEILEGCAADSPHAAAARIALLLASGRETEAYRRAIALIEAPAHTIRSLAEAQCWGAIAALRCGRLDAAWVWLGAGAVAWETYGPRAHVALLAPADRRLLWEFARDRGASNVMEYLSVPTPEVAGSSLATVELTKRERVVLHALAEHEAIRAIADDLVVSPHTVKSQLQSIYRKLGVSSRQAAIAVARELGLLDPKALTRTRPGERGKG